MIHELQMTIRDSAKPKVFLQGITRFDDPSDYELVYYA